MRFFKICKSFYKSGLLAIAVLTFRDISRQTLFYFILGVGCCLLFFSSFFTLFAFGEESRMIREMGISTIVLCCLCLASLSATSTLFTEREQGTLVTLLCKPVAQRTILLGKFFGITGVIFFVCMFMGFFLSLAITIKGFPGDYRNFTTSLISVAAFVFLKLLFSFLQVAIICSIAILGSVCLPMVSNLGLCMVVYIVGNLTQSFYGIFQENGNLSALFWFILFFFSVIPNLSEFSNIESSFESVRFVTIALMVLYTVLYVTFILTVACELFEKKECS